GAQATTNTSNSSVDVAGGSNIGGSINLAGSTPVTSVDTTGDAENANGGSMQFIAFSGTGSVPGTVVLPTGVTLLTGGNGTGSNGTVKIIAGAGSGTSITTGAIDTTGGT